MTDLAQCRIFQHYPTGSSHCDLQFVQLALVGRRLYVYHKQPYPVGPLPTKLEEYDNHACFYSYIFRIVLLNINCLPIYRTSE